ncbi:mucin-2-like [Portunus trituberculatus]|uniref:mucin-2-like n=1 Tax=Portunus trituberculatus TaxID=210409 RepID=UPI001E1CEBD7|nr:mucin-2-like [Portunus trituberculatus]
MISGSVVTLAAVLAWTSLHASVDMRPRGWTREWRKGGLVVARPFQPLTSEPVRHAPRQRGAGVEPAGGRPDPGCASHRAARGCLQATRATLQQQHLLFTARCLVWWVLLAVLQRLLWPRLRQPRVPRPAALRCLSDQGQATPRPSPPPLPSSIALPLTPITASAPSPAVFKCSAETFMPHVAAALPQTGVAGRAPNTPPPPSHLPPVTAASPRRCLPTGHLTDSPPPPFTSHLPRHSDSSPSLPPHRICPILPVTSPTSISASGVSSQTPPSKLSCHTPPYSDLPHLSPTLPQTSPPSCRTTLCPNHQPWPPTPAPRTFSPRFQRPQQTIVPPAITTTTPVPLTNTGPHIKTNPLTNHVHNIPTVPHTTHGPHQQDTRGHNYRGAPHSANPPRHSGHWHSNAPDRNNTQGGRTHRSPGTHRVIPRRPAQHTETGTSQPEERTPSPPRE